MYKRQVLFWVYQAVFSATATWVRRQPFHEGLTIGIFFLFTATAFGGLIRTLREELRALGSLCDDEPNHDPFA